MVSTETHVMGLIGVMEKQIKKEVNIFHLDDDQTFLDLIKRFIEMYNLKNGTDIKINIKNAYSAKEALTELVFHRDKPVDILICDYMMPEMSGLKFVETLHNHDLYLPTILFTSIQKQIFPFIDIVKEKGLFYLEKSKNMLRELPKMVSNIHHMNFGIYN